MPRSLNPKPVSLSPEPSALTNNKHVRSLYRERVPSKPFNRREQQCLGCFKRVEVAIMTSERKAKL